MKKNKRLIILLMILVILIIIAIIVNTKYKTNEFQYTFIKGTEWTLKDEETMYLYENGTLSYYDNKTGDTITGFNTCTNYELEGNIIKLNCDKEFKIISASDSKLYLKVDNKTKIFDKKETKNYKTFQVGYIENVKTPVLLTNHNDFITYLETYKNEFYYGDGEVVSTSTDAIKNQYDSIFFDDKNIAIYYVETNSGGVKLNGIKTLINNNTLEVQYEKVIPEVSTMDMNGYMIVVEVDKTVTKVK